MMAHGYARASGKPGLVNTSSGPGTTNAGTGMVNALLDAAPVILLAGASPLRNRDLEDFQEVDQFGAMRPLSKWAVEVTQTRRIPESLATLTARRSARPGPVHLDFPGDVLYSEVEEEQVVWGRSARPCRRPPMGTRCARPCGCSEGGAAPARPHRQRHSLSGASEALHAFVERTRIPFFPTPQGRGAIPDDHPLTFASARSTAFREADVLLVIGTRFNVILGFGRAPRFASDVKVIMINTGRRGAGQGPVRGPAHRGRRPRRPDAFLAEADRAGDWPKETPWVRHLGEVDRRKAAKMAPLLTSEQTPIHPLRLCHELSRFMERDAILFCVDGHDTLNFARQSIPTFVPGHRLNAGPNRHGGGDSLRGRAQVARPDKQVIALTGDGSFGMNGFEIDTAVREHLPVITVICNNGGWTANHPPKPGRDLPFTQYERIVEVLGGHGERVERPEDIRPALDRAAKAGVPACVNVICDPAAKSETTRFSSYFQQQQPS